MQILSCIVHLCAPSVNLLTPASPEHRNFSTSPPLSLPFFPSSLSLSLSLSLLNSYFNAQNLANRHAALSERRGDHVDAVSAARAATSVVIAGKKEEEERKREERGSSSPERDQDRAGRSRYTSDRARVGEKSCSGGQMPATSRHYSGETNCRRIIFVPRESHRAATATPDSSSPTLFPFRPASMVISRAQTCLSQSSRWERCNLQADITTASCLPLHLSG